MLNAFESQLWGEEEGEQINLNLPQGNMKYELYASSMTKEWRDFEWDEKLNGDRAGEKQ